MLRAQAGRYRCAVCSRGMGDCEITVLAQQENRALVRVRCVRCHDENLLQIVLQTDDMPEELLADDKPPIAADEVLDLHQLLSSHTGDLVSLLSGRGREDGNTGA